MTRFVTWLRASSATLGTRRSWVTLGLSGIAAGFAVWWSLSGYAVVVQVLVGLMITAALMVFFVGVVAGWLRDDGGESPSAE